jgi:hypothetical protein
MSVSFSYFNAKNISCLLKQLILLKNKCNQENNNFKQDKLAGYFEKKPRKIYCNSIFFMFKVNFFKSNFSLSEKSKRSHDICHENS